MNVSILDSTTLQELITQEGEIYDVDSSDKESVKSDKEDFLLNDDEEVKNNYSFLDSFKKTRKKNMKKEIKIPKTPLTQEAYKSD